MKYATSDSERATQRLNVDPERFRQLLNREPFSLTHDLSGLEIFSMDSLRDLAKRFHDKKEYYVASGAPTPDTKFYSVPHSGDTPVQAFDKLEKGAYRILLKRVDQHDDRFRKLLDQLFKEVLDLKGGLGNDRLERLESAVLISSAATTTPFHFDPEVNFFCQISGEKIYHVYSPVTIAEDELERFYFRGTVNIGQIPLAGRNPNLETVFTLGPGLGLHQPQNAPHWVETREGLSVSYAFVFETTATRLAGRTRAFNFYLRKLGVKPRVLGQRPSTDAVKAQIMRTIFGAYLPIRRAVGNGVRKIQR